VVSAAHIGIVLLPKLRTTKVGSATTEVKTAVKRYAVSNCYLHASRRAGAARIDLNGDVAGTVTPTAAKHAHQLLSERRRRNLAARATITYPAHTGDSAIPNKIKGHGAPPCASVAKGVRLRHEQYFTS
jgi:sRNA-binding protein